MKSSSIYLYIAIIASAVFIFFVINRNKAPHFNSQIDFPFNIDYRLKYDLLLYQQNSECERVALGISKSELHIREARSISNSLYEEIFGRSASNSKCSLACLDMGSPGKYITRIIPEKQYHFSDNNTESSVSVHDWYNDVCEMKEVGFGSYSDQFSVYWLNASNHRNLVQKLVEPGYASAIWLESYIGHKFEIVNPETEASLGIYEVSHDSFYAVGEFITGVNQQFRTPSARTLTDFMRHSFKHQWDIHTTIKRTFTELGFQRGRLPPDLFNYLSTYYYNNQYQYLREDGNDQSLTTNFWQADTHMIVMPFRIKRYWQRRLMPLVEAWSNTTLSLTSIYGLRRYHEGARLLAHVDKTITHAISLIINIAQNHLSEPWKVEIYDHAERLHEIEMEEGDIVYYESAKCLHSRMRALRGSGSYYVNLFAHYMPKDDPAWFEKDLPEGCPAPIIDLDGVDIPRVMPFLNPRRRLKSADDLLDHWVQVGETPEDDPLAAAYINGVFPAPEDPDEARRFCQH